MIRPKNSNGRQIVTHMPKPVYEEGDVTVLWHQAVQTDRQVTANRPDIILKNKKLDMHTDRSDSTCGEKCRAKGSKKETKIQQFMDRNTTNMEHEMHDHTVENWSHRMSNKRFKEKFGSCTRKTFDRLTTKDSYTWNITHNTESTAV
jgi:hypothetical protein